MRKSPRNDPLPDDDSESPRESIPEDAERWRRERFIPLRKVELARQLAAELPPASLERRMFIELCRIVEATFHFQFHRQLELLKDAYSAVDPDSDTRALGAPDATEREEKIRCLFMRCGELLSKANYRRLTRRDLSEAIGAASDWGVRLHVDFDIFEHVEVHARGDIVGRRVRKRWSNWYRAEEVDVPIYQRLVVIFRLREHKRMESHVDTDTVYIKLFKNIPKMDVDMMLPGTRVCMSLLDRGKILLPTVSGLGLTIFKIIKGALVLAFAGIYGILAFVCLVGGTIGYGLKSFFGYLRTRDKYQLNLTRSLYYQNLDNNAGVLYRLIDEAEEQEFRETILAYFLLWQHAGDLGWSQRELDERAEAKLREVIGVDVNFDVRDALEKLRRQQIAEPSTGDRWRAVPIQQALARIDAAWDGYFQHESGGHRVATTSAFDS